MGSHALNDGFAVISWCAAGYNSGGISLLWSEAVLAEVATFFLPGRWLIARSEGRLCSSTLETAWTTLHHASSLGLSRSHGTDQPALGRDRPSS